MALSLATLTLANPAAARFERLHDMGGHDGMDTYSRVLIHDNTLYTTAVRGGAVDKGTLLALDLNTGATQVLHHFTGVNGRSPFNLSAVLDGSIWGVTRSDEINYGGMLFRYEIATGVVSYEHRFGGGGDAGHHLLYGPMALDGVLYGTTNQGGTTDNGTLYRYDPATGLLETLHHFASGSGTRPFGGLIEHDGWLLGTVSDITLREQDDPPNTEKGGLFRIRPDGSDYSLVYAFEGGDSGGHPYSNLSHDGGDWFYGTTLGEYNNLDDQGVIFRIRTDFSEYQVIHNFGARDDDGSKPNGDILISTDDGKLYGFAHGTLTAPLGDGSPVFGEAVEAGTLFSLNPDGSDFDVLHRFDSPENGLVPERTPALRNTTLYGAAAHGGDNASTDRPDGMGTLFAWHIEGAVDEALSPAEEGTEKTTDNAATGAFGSVWLVGLWMACAWRRWHKR